jgi:magnesium-transporting ATPase (P-type)
MALAAVVTSQIGNVFAQRTERASVFQIGWFSNRLIWVGIAIELLLIGCIVYLPPIQNFIGTSHFPLENWLFLFIWTPILLLADEARKAVLRWYERRRD